MQQPVSKQIIANHPECAQRKVTTLLVDGSNLLELCFSVSKKYNSDGRNIGTIYQFLLMLRILLKKGDFDRVYVFFDGPSSGQMRYDLNHDYKANREDKFFEDKKTEDDSDGELSEYMKEFNRRVENMQRWAKGKKGGKSESEKENFMWQKEVIEECLENLFILTVEVDKTEADDLIGYYCAHKAPNERIVIASNDRDLTQLIGDDVIIYIQSFKDFVNRRNHTQRLGYYYENVVLKKMICGDSSDNIKGIKGVGEKTLFDHFPQFKERKVTLQEVIDGAKKINEDRVAEKRKPLQWALNIENAVTDGAQGKDIYEINRRIIDLHDPLMPQEAKDLMEEFIGAPIDPEGRDMSNVYKILKENGVEDLLDPNSFANFFVDYERLAKKEKDFFQKCQK